MRAVRAAIELRAAVQALNVDLMAEGVRYTSRVGVETGEVVVGGSSASLQDVISGQVVTVAGRLQQAGGDGEVIVGAAAQRLVRGAVVLNPAHDLAAGTGGVAAWRVLDVVRGQAGSLEIARLASVRPPGRAHPVAHRVPADSPGGHGNPVHGGGRGGDREVQTGQGVHRIDRLEGEGHHRALPGLRERHHLPPVAPGCAGGGRPAWLARDRRASGRRGRRRPGRRGDRRRHRADTRGRERGGVVRRRPAPVPDAGRRGSAGGGAGGSALGRADLPRPGRRPCRRRARTRVRVVSGSA